MDQLILEKMLQNIVNGLRKQNEYLSKRDKDDYPLIYRAAERINDYFRRERIEIKKIDIQAPTPERVEFSVNGSTTFSFDAAAQVIAEK